jgi:hypothetical protein
MQSSPSTPFMPSMTSEDAAAMHAPRTGRPNPSSRNGARRSKSSRYPAEPAQLLEILRSCARNLLARPGVQFVDNRIPEWLISFSVLPGFPAEFDGPPVSSGKLYPLRWFIMYPTYAKASLPNVTAETAVTDLSRLAHALSYLQLLNNRVPADYSTPYARNVSRTVVKLAGTFHHHGAHARKLRARELNAERSAARRMLQASP